MRVHLIIVRLQFSGVQMPTQRCRAFMSYAHVDNKYGQLAEFRDRLSNEVQVQTGQEFPIFLDRNDILLGQEWHQRIADALREEATFLIAVITPSFFKSDACREELTTFLKHEEALSRKDLIFPIYYVNCRALQDAELMAEDPLSQAIATRQWADWRGLRFEPFESPVACKAVMQIAAQIGAAIDRLESAALSRRLATPKVKTQEAQEIQETHRPLRIFISYAHHDEQLAEELRRHLSVLRRAGVVSEWYDRKIVPGVDWTRQISDQMEQSEIILLLISSDFLASDYCYDVEVVRALEKHARGEAWVIPVILRPCDWGRTAFAKLQALPSDAKPVTMWANRDEAFTNVANGIRLVARSRAT
jgi:hypothetical protein